MVGDQVVQVDLGKAEVLSPVLAHSTSSPTHNTTLRRGLVSPSHSLDPQVARFDCVLGSAPQSHKACGKMALEPLLRQCCYV